MNRLFAILPLLFAAAAATAADSVPSPEQAEKNLKAAQRQLAAATAAAAAKLPESKADLPADNATWRKKVEAECAPESVGLSNAASAAALYARETQCMADATAERARIMRALAL